MAHEARPKGRAEDRAAASVDGIAASLRRASTAVDAEVDSWFEGHRGHRRIQEVLFATSLLAESVLVIAGGATALADSPRARVTRDRLMSLAIVAGLNIVAKRMTDRRRPFRPDERPVHLDPDTSSYPSGHTLWALLAAAWLAEDRWPPWLAYSTAAFVSVSRVHLRLHRASDVVTTAAVTTGAWTVARRGGGRAAQSRAG